jgi:hypothetical protein
VKFDVLFVGSNFNFIVSFSSIIEYSLTDKGENIFNGKGTYVYGINFEVKTNGIPENSVSL